MGERRHKAGKRYAAGSDWLKGALQVPLSDPVDKDALTDRVWQANGLARGGQVDHDV